MTDSVGFQFRERKGEDEFTNNIPSSAMHPVDTILLEKACSPSEKDCHWDCKCRKSQKQCRENVKLNTRLDNLSLGVWDG